MSFVACIDFITNRLREESNRAWLEAEQVTVIGCSPPTLIRISRLEVRLSVNLFRLDVQACTVRFKLAFQWDDGVLNKLNGGENPEERCQNSTSIYIMDALVRISVSSLKMIKDEATVLFEIYTHLIGTIACFSNPILLNH